MNWWKSLKGKVKLEEQLGRHTSFKIGGRAKFFIQPYDTKDLKLLINCANRYNIPVLVMGAGSNILVSDSGVDAVVIKLSSAEFKKISCKENSIQAGSAVTLRQLMQAALEKKLSGLEFLSGIPGTLGGALVMNAGLSGKGICCLADRVKVMDYRGRIKTLLKNDLKFAYRKSNLDKFIILNARLRLAKKSRKEIGITTKQYASYRRSSQDTALPNAGCIFKNPPGESAGKLIDLCGLKGKMSGGARISDKHANFILNSKSASSADVLKLMELARNTVKQKFDVKLEPEIKIWK